MGGSDQPELRKKRRAKDKKKGKEQIYSQKHIRMKLIAKSNTSHTTLESENVVVNGVQINKT